MTMDKPRYVYVTYIATTPEKLWAALTAPEFTERYFYKTRVESEWKPGSPVTYRMDEGRIAVHGEIIHCEAPRCLSMTWHVDYNLEMKRERPSRVTFELEPIGGVVKLTTTHDEFEPDSKVYPEIREGWPGILCSLKSLLETGKPLPIAGG